MPHPMASFLPPPPVLSPLQDQQRSILRQPTFRWSSALASRQCFSSAKYAKEGLIRKPVFDNFQPPPLTARDVGLLPPCAGVGVGAPFAAPSRGTAIGGFFPPLPAHHHLQPSSRFGVPLHKLRPPLHKLRPLLRAPRFTPSEAHSRIFESVTIPKPRSASLSELRAPSLIGQGVRRRRRGQPRSPSHSMTTRSSQSGAQAGKGPLQQGSSVASPLLTCALTSASFSTFTAQPTSLPAEPTIHRPSSTSSSSSLLMFASSLQLAGRGPGMGGKEKVSSLPQENLTKEKDTEERNEEENKREGRQQVAGMLKKGKAQPCKMEKSRPLKSTEPPKAQDFSDTPGRGPRIKHVCRRAAVALGRNRAVFPDDLPTLSALPWEERENILSSMGNDDKSSVAGSEEAERPVPPVRPAMRPRVVPDSRRGRDGARAAAGSAPAARSRMTVASAQTAWTSPNSGGATLRSSAAKRGNARISSGCLRRCSSRNQGKSRKIKKRSRCLRERTAVNL
ncbi:hypothetical protein ANANG_G00233810 [Anguilla anguilla]|uniref:Uncharacterized protein n=1 Tax=Anguilla anguilla TaxID=7936 RepID=A0A9D3RRD9_ANGAN|nr:hypothetical protein ANANG_G00233810 [Anguilla anguilla]